MKQYFVIRARYVVNGTVRVILNKLMLLDRERCRIRETVLITGTRDHCQLLSKFPQLVIILAA